VVVTGTFALLSIVPEMAGLLLGLAVLMKQTGAVFGLFAAAWIFRWEFSCGHRTWRRLAARLAALALGGLLPLSLTCLVLATAGDFPQFWLWTVEYARAHASIFSLGNGIKSMFANVGRQYAAAPGLWSVAVLGFISLLGDRSLPGWRFFIFSFCLFSFLAVCPGWYFRGHYFIQLLPAAGLLAAAACHSAGQFLPRLGFSRPMAIWPPLIFAAAAASLLIQDNAVYFRLTPAAASRAIYGDNPFPEAVVVGRYLASHCAPDDRIAVIGSEPEIYFYSRRRAATGYICIYPLVEPQPYAPAMREAMIREVEASRPAYVVYVSVRGSWVQSTAQIGSAIFDWFERYQRAQLELVGLVEIPPAGPATYRWFERPVTNVQTSAESWLAIFKRRSSGENP
jgi:hypothetical protein